MGTLYVVKILYVDLAFVVPSPGPKNTKLLCGARVVYLYPYSLPSFLFFIKFHEEFELTAKYNIFLTEVIN